MQPVGTPATRAGYASPLPAPTEPSEREAVTFNVVVPRRQPGRWVALVILLWLAAAFAQNVATNENFHWDVFVKYVFAPQVTRGVGWTVVLTVAAMALAIGLALALVAMRGSDNPTLNWMAWFWIWLFRGTPVYTQLLFWGLFAVLFPRVSLSIPWGPELFGFQTKTIVTPAVAAIVGLGFNESAYLAEIFRAGFDSIERGQLEAAQALGMPRRKAWRRILMPQAMRVIVPPTGNETIGMLKMTSLVLAVPFTLDLMFATNAIANRLYLPVPLLLVAGFWYLSVTSLLMIGQHYLEQYFGRGISTMRRAK